MGVAYYARYLEWFEQSRTDLLREFGCPYTEWESRGYRLPVVEAHAEYRGSARYDERIEVVSFIESLTPVAIRIGYEVFVPGRSESVVTGYTRHAVVGPRNRIARMPEDFRAALA